MPYLWMKAVHVAAVLLFIGGLFAQTFALAAGARGARETVALVSTWDRRVTVPAMLILWLAGATIAVQGAWFGSGWLSAKLVLVVVLTGLHGMQSGKLRRLNTGGELKAPFSSFRTAVFVGCSTALIALLVVIKPF